MQKWSERQKSLTYLEPYRRQPGFQNQHSSARAIFSSSSVVLFHQTQFTEGKNGVLEKLSFQSSESHRHSSVQTHHPGTPWALSDSLLQNVQRTDTYPGCADWVDSGANDQGLYRTT